MKALDSQTDGLAGFPNSLLHRKDPPTPQRPLNYHLAPPNAAFAPHPSNGRPFPTQYPIARLPFRVNQPQHPSIAHQNQQQQQQQLSPAYAGGGHSASFFSGNLNTHRVVQSPTLDDPESVGAEEIGSSIRRGHHAGLPQHNRVSSSGEDGHEGSMGGGEYHTIHFYFFSQKTHLTPDLYIWENCIVSLGWFQNADLKNELTYGSVQLILPLHKAFLTDPSNTLAQPVLVENTVGLFLQDYKLLLQSPEQGRISWNKKAVIVFVFSLLCALTRRINTTLCDSSFRHPRSFGSRGLKSAATHSQT